MIEIRPATERDIPAILSLADSLVREDAGQRDRFANLDWVQEEGEARFGQLVSDDNGACFVAITGDEAIGFATVRLQPPDFFSHAKGANLGSLYVRPTHRGQGVGEQLVAAILEWARANDAERVTVSAFAANEGGLRFYQRLGFAPQTVTLQQTIERQP